MGLFSLRSVEIKSGRGLPLGLRERGDSGKTAFLHFSYCFCINAAHTYSAISKLQLDKLRADFDLHCGFDCSHVTFTALSALLCSVSPSKTSQMSSAGCSVTRSYCMTFDFCRMNKWPDFRPRPRCSLWYTSQIWKEPGASSDVMVFPQLKELMGWSKNKNKLSDVVRLREHCSVRSDSTTAIF